MAKGSTSPDCQSTSRRKTSADCHWISAANRSRLEDVGSISWVTPIYSHIIPYPYHCRFPLGQMHGSQIPRTTVPSVPEWPKNHDDALNLCEITPHISDISLEFIGCIQCLAPTNPNHTSHGMVLIPVVCKKTTVRRSQCSQQPRYKMSVSTIRMTVPGVLLPMQPEMFFSWRLLTSSSWPNRDFIKPPSCQEISK